MGVTTSTPQQEGTVGSDEAGSSSRVEESDEKRGADSTPLNVPSAEPQSPIKDVAITEEKQIEKIPTEQTIQEAPADQLENNEDQEAEPLGTEGGLTPDNATLLAAVKSFQAQNLAMGCAKVLEELKAYYGWELSKMRLKKCMNTYHLNTEENESKIEEAEARPPKLPPNPLQAQLKCVDMVLYGRGECNFGVTPNPDMGPVLDDCKDTIVKTLEMYYTPLAHSPQVQHLWSFYKASAKIAGLRLEDVARQFQADAGSRYKTDPRMGEEKDPAKAEAVEYAKAEEYKIEKIMILRELAKVNPKSATLDSSGDPVYDEAKHGQYVVTVSRIDQHGKVY